MPHETSDAHERHERHEPAELGVGILSGFVDLNVLVLILALCFNLILMSMVGCFSIMQLYG